MSRRDKYKRGKIIAIPLKLHVIWKYVGILVPILRENKSHVLFAIFKIWIDARFEI